MAAPRLDLAHVISPEEAGTLDGLLGARVRRTPDSVAYRDFNSAHANWRDYTWAQIDRQVARWQAALERDGLKPGDRVAVMLRNSTEWVTFDQAALGLGLVAVPLYTQDRPDNVAYILNDAGCKVLLLGTHEQWKTLAGALDQLASLTRILTIEDQPAPAEEPRLRPVRQWLPDEGGATRHVPRDPGALATVVYTSGTTGRPKGVMLSHRNILSNAYACLQVVPVDGGDTSASMERSRASSTRARRCTGSSSISRRKSAGCASSTSRDAARGARRCCCGRCSRRWSPTKSWRASAGA